MSKLTEAEQETWDVLNKDYSPLWVNNDFDINSMYPHMHTVISISKDRSGNPENHTIKLIKNRYTGKTNA